tara:strand:+ start:271 stop:591 length:321 start_codon:yes stop_codon:yes gene_type:complete
MSQTLSTSFNTLHNTVDTANITHKNINKLAHSADSLINTADSFSSIPFSLDKYVSDVIKAIKLFYNYLTGLNVDDAYSFADYIKDNLNGIGALLVFISFILLLLRF